MDEWSWSPDYGILNEIEKNWIDRAVEADGREFLLYAFLDGEGTEGDSDTRDAVKAAVQAMAGVGAVPLKYWVFKPQERLFAVQFESVGTVTEFLFYNSIRQARLLFLGELVIQAAPSAEPVMVPVPKKLNRKERRKLKAQALAEGLEPPQ